MLPARRHVDPGASIRCAIPRLDARRLGGHDRGRNVAPYNRPPHPLNKILILETTSKATRASKKSTQPSTQHAEAARQVEHPSTDKVIKTVLIASYGWPTAEMQPSKRPATRR